VVVACFFPDGVLEARYLNNAVPANPTPSLTLNLTQDLKLHPGSRIVGPWLDVINVRNLIIDRSATVTSQGLGDDNVEGGIDSKTSGASGAGHGGSGGEGHNQVRWFSDGMTLTMSYQ